jgi:hypothetical protein
MGSCNLRSAAIIWGNAHLAVLARLHKIAPFHPMWSLAGPEAYTLTIEADGKVASALLDRQTLDRAFRGDDGWSAALTRSLSALVQSLAAALPASRLS